MDYSINALKNKLAQIEANIEEENSRGKPHRMPARYFMFFLLLGGDEEARLILERKVKELLSNPDACQFIQITHSGVALSGEAIEAVLLDAAKNHVDVQNLNNILLCPVVFANNQLGGNMVPMLTEIDAYMNRSGHTPLWQPAIIINKNFSEYQNIYSCVTEMTRFISSMPESSVNRCCWLSNTDENGFSVPMENIMQTIAMVAVLQNVVTQNANDSQTIRAKVSHSSTSEEGHHLFFTARNAAVTNPLRSLMLQRLAAAVDYFSGKSDSGDAMSRMNYSFVKEIMAPYLSLLPRHGGRITLLPLYSVMAEHGLHDRLAQVIEQRYEGPLCGPEARKAQLSQAKQAFLKNYFSQNGSLAELKQLLTDNELSQKFLDNKMACYGEIPLEFPFVDGKKLAAFTGGEYEQAARYCKNLIDNCGWDLLEAVGKEITQSNMLRNITNVQESLDQIRQCIQTRMRQLKDVETVLVVDQTEQRTNFGEIQAGWLEHVAMNNPQKYAELNMHFDRKIYELLQSEDADCCDLLDICYEAVKNTAMSNIDYLNHVGEECMKNEMRAQEFVEAVRNNWCYTLRFLKRDDTRDATCIIGDDKNHFCRSLQTKFSGSLFSFSGFDRIDILHISGAFSPETILEWAQIEACGKEAAEV